MFTIAGLANRTNLPRRAIQFWADKGVIKQMLAEDDAPRMYSLRELQICRLLRPLWMIGTPIKTLAYFSGFIRVTLDAAEQERGGDIDIIDKATSGEAAWLLVSFQDMSDDSANDSTFVRYDETPWSCSQYEFTDDPKRLGEVAAKLTLENPSKPAVVFNLTDALFYRPRAVARMSDE